MSDTLIADLNRRISELTNELATTRAESKQRRLKLRDALAENEQLKTQLDETLDAAEQWKSQAEASPGEHADRLKALEAENKGLKLRGKFGDLKLSPGLELDDVMGLMKFDPSQVDLETFDPEATVKAWREAKPGLFAGDAAASGKPAPDGAKRPALTLKVETPTARGVPDRTVSRVTYSREELKRSNWQQTRPELVEALRAGTAELID